MSERVTKTFPTGAVLSAATGMMLSESGMGGIYEILSWMSGEKVYTHQIPRIRKEAEKVILDIHPHLVEAQQEAALVTPENVQIWLRTWKDRYGEEIAVPKMNIAEHERIDPESELAEMVPPDRIIRI